MDKFTTPIIKGEQQNERIVLGKQSEEDVILNLSLRPQGIKDFVGQRTIS